MTKQYKKLKLSSLAGILGGFLLLALSPSVMAQKRIDPDNIVSKFRYRQLYMSTKAKHNQAIRLLVTKKIYLFDHIRMHAAALSDMAEIMPQMFEKQSIAPQSRALPKIWNSKGEVTEEFMTAAATMQREAKRLKDIAKTGNVIEIGKQTRVLARNCQACHKKFRGERKE